MLNEADIFSASPVASSKKYKFAVLLSFTLFNYTLIHIKTLYNHIKSKKHIKQYIVYVLNIFLFDKQNQNS